MAARKIRKVRSKKQPKTPEVPPKRRRRRVRIRMTGEFCAKVIAAIKARGEASAPQLAQDVGVSVAVIRRALKKLAAREQIVSIGDKRKRYQPAKTGPAQPKVAPAAKPKGQRVVRPTAKPKAKGPGPGPEPTSRAALVAKLIEVVQAELTHLTSIQQLLEQEDQIRSQIRYLLRD